MQKSPSQLAASRTNGAKSRGPLSPSGKAHSSRNALKHGLHSPRIGLPNESQHDFDLLLAELLRTFRPANPAEHKLVLDLASIQWRIDRTQRLEHSMLAGTQYNRREEFSKDQEGDDSGLPLEDARTAQAYSELISTDILEKVHLHEARLHRLYHRSVQLLLKLKAANLTAPKNIENEPSNSLKTHHSDVGWPAGCVDAVAPIPTDEPQVSESKNPQNEPSNALQTQHDRILAYCQTDAFLHSFAPLAEVRAGRLTYDAYLSEIRATVTRLLQITDKKSQNEPSNSLIFKDAA